MAQSLEAALERIQSDKKSIRVVGLNDLKNVLKFTKNGSELRNLKDKFLLSIFEDLFRVITREKAAYSKATKSNLKSIADSRLVACADALRLCVDSLVHVLKARTLKAIISHILQTVPSSDGTYCQPLSVQYLKALATIFSFCPHVEHLAHRDWTDAVDFCVDGIVASSYDFQSPTASDRASSHTISREWEHDPGLSFGYTSQGRIHRAADWKPMTEALVESLAHLVTATNSPIQEKANAILHTVLAFQSSATSTTGILNCFKICNIILSRTSLESEKATRANLKAIIPLIKTFWLSKEPGLSDEMLKTLVILQPFLTTGEPMRPREDLHESLSSLLNVLIDDYVREGRPQRHLNLSDLDLDGHHMVDEAIMPMRNRTYGLRYASENSEHNWTLLHFVALLTSIVDGARDQMRGDNLDDVAELFPRKRRKLTGVFEHMLHTVSETGEHRRERSAQMVATITNTVPLSIEAVRSAMDSLLGLISQSTSEVVSWALVGVAGCVTQSSARQASSKALWQTLWQSAFRLINSVSQSRLACHALTAMMLSGYLDQADIIESLDSMTDDEGLNGPAILSDAAVWFWSEAIRFLDENGHGNASRRCADRYELWIGRTWSPGSFTNRHCALHFTQSISPRSLIFAIEKCFNPTADPCNPGYTRLLHVGQTWLERKSTSKLSDYLLLRDHGLNLLDCSQEAVHHRRQSIPLASSTYANVGERLVEHLNAESKRALESWEEAMGSRQSRMMTTESVQMLMCMLLAADRIFILVGHNKTGHLQSLCKRKDQLLELLSDYLAKSDTSIETAYAALYTVGCVQQILPILSHSGDGPMQHYPSKSFCAYLAEVYRSRSYDGANASQDEDFDDEPMDADANSQVLPQCSNRASDGRCDSTFLSSHSTYYNCVSGSLIFTITFQADVDTASSATVPAAFAKYLHSLPSQNFLSLRPLLLILEETQVFFAATDAESLLERIAVELLPSYEHRRCEASIQSFMQFMRMTVSLWTEPENLDLANMGSQIYDWLVDLVFDAGASSPTVQNGLSQMLFGMLETKPDFTSHSNGPSIRTNLLRILKQGQLPVQFHIANGIPELLSRFVLSQHELIFEDIQNSLPYDAEWSEGLAIRLLVLSRLAITWNTLLRRSVYHIFETAGLVVSTERHARFCLRGIATALDLSSPKELYLTFRSQLIHTWLDAHPVASIPFGIFGYTSLEELVTDSRSELVSQCIVKAKEEDLKTISAQTNQNVQDIVMSSFSQVAAYSIAYDASRINPDPDPAKSVEHRVRQLVGKHAYSKSITGNLPGIVGHLFKRLDYEDSFEKAFARRKGYEQAAEAFERMRNLDSNDSFLPSSQQPSFPSKYLLDELERLERRAGLDPHTIWTQPVLAAVARMILDDIRPALGSLQSRKVIRRIRILVALSGPCIVQGYALEMLLHALRPFLSDKNCARDTIGVYKYLLETGGKRLRDTPDLVAGTFLAIFLETRDLLCSTQDSTTQESEHRTTLEKAEGFRKWLRDWVVSFKSPTLPKPFQSMMRHAGSTTGDGTAEVGSSAAKLLLDILSDRGSGKALLSRQAANAALSLLCNDRFHVPSSFRTDVLGADDQAAKYAAQVWHSCREAEVGQPYLQWAARVLGRSFNHLGKIHPAMNAETELKVIKERTDARNALLSSKGAILCLLVDQLRGASRESVGSAEDTLRRILYETRDSDEGHLIQDHLPDLVAKALLPNAENVLAKRARRIGPNVSLRDCLVPVSSTPTLAWLHNVCLALINAAGEDVLLGGIRSILEQCPNLCQDIFPYILHCVLHNSVVSDQGLDVAVSGGFRAAMKASNNGTASQTRHLIQGLLFLRTQALPKEGSRLRRTMWLDVDYEEAAHAAVACRMLKSALMLVEIGHTILSEDTTGSTRRTSARQVELAIPHELLLSIFRDLDEPDSFHGVPQHPSLEAIADRLAFEGNGIQELLLRGARNDGAIRLGHGKVTDRFGTIVNSLARLSMSSLISQLGSSSGIDLGAPVVAESVAKAALKLRQWDIAIPHQTSGNSSTVYRTLQSVQLCRTTQDMSKAVDAGFAHISQTMIRSGCVGQQLRSANATLAALMDVDEVLSIRVEADLRLVQKRFEQRQQWMLNGSLEDASHILSTRETMLGMVCDSKDLRSLLCIDLPIARQMDVEAVLQSSSIFRAHKALQEALNNVTYLSDIVAPCRSLGMDISGAVKYETAKVLWDHGELLPSIRTLQELEQAEKLDEQTLPVSKAALLATLGHNVSEARSEKPEDVIEKYLLRALKELHRSEKSTRHDSGHVYHEYGHYCHAQLTSPENVAEMDRSSRFTAKRHAEVLELERILGTRLSDHEKHRVKSDRNKSKKWYDIDKTENDRLRKGRDQLLRQALEAYLRSLAASDDHDTDILRFLALWLEHAANPISSDSVLKQIGNVPTLKFAPLMNQLASRLQDTSEKFQDVMMDLVGRVCLEHPYHGIYHIYAGSKTQGGNDRIAISRNAAAKKISERLLNNTGTSDLWTRICRANDLYMALACARSDSFKPGTRIALRKYSPSKAIEREIPQLKVPPITLEIPLRADCDYSNIATVDSFRPEMAIAGGLSAPKILTALTSSGQSCKQLFKAGADDLRQDSIMEQVFDQVSSLLRSQRETRQRKLGIRTYKVIPLDATSGAIEFVQSTLPLNDYLKTAHPHYHPKDLKWDSCRSKIEEVRNRSLETRVKTFRNITENFSPVLRHFFFERFEDPDEWFVRRLAYTRSTAAISILGHALGLGDRHCQNILLDTSTGEVVHIDLGVAFEAGRILAVPEVVPFRLTRDIVDGFGIMGTEGVYRRCCEFMLEALRHNRDAVMTLLNVLRYDPLYSWSMSPLRAKRLQEEQDREVSEAASAAPSTAAAKSRSRPSEDGTRNNQGVEPVAAPKVDAISNDDEGGEADRALSVVERKLAPGLSVMATVNELIQSATDEKNLAVLFCGWAAYA